jgi:dCMP deaminase
VRPDVLYVLGKSFAADLPMLERDVRALDPQEVAIAAQAMGLAPQVRVLEREDIPTLLTAARLIFSDDEVMRQVADTYLPRVPVIFETAFLRWDKMAAITAQPVDPDMIISRSEIDRLIMQAARTSAQRSSDWWRQVGAVIIKDGKAILVGHNQHQPTEHAPYIDGDPRSNFNAGERIDISTALHGESGLIACAAQQGISLQGASIAVTTFPCPNCALLIIRAGITTVYYADGYSNLHGQENFRLAGVGLVRVMEA